MNSPKKSHTDEINLLLTKIDEYESEITTLKTELESEKKIRNRLESRLEMIEKNKLLQTKQQTRIMREQEKAVRDLSCELDHVSKKLKKSVKKTFSWEDKVEVLKTKLQNKEQEYIDLENELKRTKTKMKKQEEELRDAQTIVELYEQLKLQSRTEEMRLHQERKSVYNRAKEIYKSYRDIQNEISRSEIKLKENLSKSAVLPLNLDKEIVETKREGKKEIHLDKKAKIIEKKLNIFKTENAFLKKKIINLLNQYCAELVQNSSHISDVELSVYQKSLRNVEKKSSSVLPINSRKKSISRLMNSRKNNNTENSLFKINTLKLPKIKIKNEKKSENKINIENSFHVNSKLKFYESRKKSDDLAEKDKRGNSIKSDLVKSNQFKISCIESSSVIGGQTFHVVTQKNLRKISKTSEHDNKQFISNKYF
jgi:chromosome segregation ATPase